MSVDITSNNVSASNIESRNRIFGRTVGKATFRPDLVSQGYNRLRMFGSKNDYENMPERTLNTTFQRRISQTLRANETNKSFHFNHGSFLKKTSENDEEGFGQFLRRNDSINSSLMSKNFGLQSRNLSGLYPEGNFRLNHEPNLRSHDMFTISKNFSSGLQNRRTYNEPTIDDEGFRRPLFSRVIKGRNSTLTSRLLHEQRHCKDLNNISSVNVSKIFQKERDTFSESRLALNTRLNCVDNQSVASSFISVTSIKSQFMNVLESLHSSILNIGPRLTAEAVRTEIERAKQKLEIISERSFAFSVKDAGEASVISHSSKNICPPISELNITNTLDGNSLHLKSSKDILKTLVSGKGCPHSREKEKEEEDLDSLFQHGKSDDEDISEVVFKKPKSKSSSLKKNKIVSTPRAKNKRISKGPKWLTSPEKKSKISSTSRAKNEKISKSPKPPTSPEKKNKVASTSRAKNERILKSPKRLTSPEKKNKIVSTSRAKNERISKSPKLPTSPDKKNKIVSTSRTKSERISRSPKPAALPKKKHKTNTTMQTKSAEVVDTPVRRTEVQTRSGRTVKPPSMFWLVSSKSNEIISIGNPEVKRVEKKTKEVKEVKVQLRSDDTTRQSKPFQTRSERKRKIAADVDAVQSKKSKIEKKTKIEMEVRMDVGGKTTKKARKLKSKAAAARSPQANKSPPARKKSKPVNKKTIKASSDSKKKIEVRESDEDIELSLDDIHVPEVARLSEDPLLSRSQLRLAAMETPPLKYFNSNLRLLKSATPVQSPDWYISQRTESEARKFQKRREEAFKHTSRVDVVKKTVTEKKTTKNAQSKDLKRMMDWVAEKAVKTPQWNSKVLQYVIPSRKRMEMEENDEDEDVETEFM